jgi:glycosyltransferase involved in cell wall biosynthesis
LLLGEQVAARKDHPAVENLRVVYFVRTQDEGGVVSGAARQLRQYAEFAGRAGCTAVIHPSLHELGERFDVAHLSNLDWSVETAHQLRLAKRCARRVVISPIHHRRRWVSGVPASDRGGAGRIAAEVTSQDGFERLRNFYLAGRNPRLIPEATRQLVTGVTRRQRDILGACDAWFLLAKGERESLDEDLDPSPRETFVVPNGADWTDRETSLNDLPSEFVLCVGRIEARKGQILVARVLERLGVPGVFVGAANSRHETYVAEFRKLIEGSRHLRWLRDISHGEILSLYPEASVHVLASRYEVAPLVDLEAAVAGCRVVTTTHGHTSEYLGDWGVYWDPDSHEAGLRKAIERGLELGPDREAGERFRAILSWDLMARAVLDGYGSILG